MILATVLALVISTSAGLALVKSLWAPEKGETSDFFLQLALALGLGLGATSLVLFVILSFRGSAGRTAELLADTVLLLFLLFAWFLRRPVPLGNRAKWQWPRLSASLFWLGALAIASLSNLASFALLSLKAPYGSWDGWSIWNLHARFLFRGGQFWRDIFSPLLWYYKPDYPLLVPASIARLWYYSNRETLLAPILVAAIFTFALALLTGSAVARLRGGKQGMLAALILLGTPALAGLGSSQCADIPVAFFFLATLVLLCLNDCLGRNSGYLVLAGLAAGMAIWTKNEGIMLLVCVIAARLLLWAQALGARALIKQQIPFFAGLTPVVLPVIYFKMHLVPVNDMVAGQGLKETVARLVSLTRYRVTFKAFLHQTFSFGGWSLPIVLVLAFYALLVGFSSSGKIRKATAAPALTILAAAAGYFFVYIVTPHDVAWQIKWSLDRIFMQLGPAAIFSAFLFLLTPDEAIQGEEGSPRVSLPEASASNSATVVSR